MSIALTTFILVVVPQVNDFNAVETEVEFLGQFLYALIVAQQHRLTDALVLGLHGGFEHGGVYGLGKNHPLWMFACRVIEFLGKFALLPQHLSQSFLVAVPIVDSNPCHPTLYCCLGHGCRHLSDQSWVNGLGNKIIRAKGQFVHLIHIVHHIGHGLFSQIGNGVDSSQLHLFVDGRGVHVKGTSEDIGEAYHIVDLVGIVRPSGAHQHIGTTVHCVFIRNLRHRIGQGKHDGLIGH